MLNTKKTRLRGMTLIEVIIAMVIIILVTIIAYVGVNTSASLLQHGKDLRDSDGAAIGEIESCINQYNPDKADTKDTVEYKVEVREKSTDNNGNPLVTVITEYEQTAVAGVVTGDVNGVRYNIYMPCNAGGGE
ncbi:MAG: type II secretion system protein [Oscillospiraceae bacterium]|nr:type II secretion system GspH family protein [Oscillospiraceae bacterium]MDD6082412.1 type II secretion system protein [Oscillospiraceae bacterium]